MSLTRYLQLFIGKAFRTLQLFNEMLNMTVLFILPLQCLSHRINNILTNNSLSRMHYYQLLSRLFACNTPTMLEQRRKPTRVAPLPHVTDYFTIGIVLLANGITLTVKSSRPSNSVARCNASSTDVTTSTPILSHNSLFSGFVTKICL